MEEIIDQAGQVISWEDKKEAIKELESLIKKEETEKRARDLGSIVVKVLNNYIRLIKDVLNEIDMNTERMTFRNLEKVHNRDLTR